MKASAALRKEADAGDCWNGFRPGDWLSSINVRDFIVRNVTPYTGDEGFLAGPSQRTKAVWAKLQPYFAEERKKGVLAVDAETPSTLLAHKAGYIDRVALGRVCSPEAVADAVGWLIEGASIATGQLLQIDAGMVLGKR